MLDRTRCLEETDTMVRVLRTPVDMLPDFELHQETCAMVEHGSPFYAVNGRNTKVLAITASLGLQTCNAFYTERQTSNGEVTNASPIVGRLFVLVGAGGAGRALAFGAKSKGARVVIFNRNFGKFYDLTG
ncbi:bifunctional 3-dehydroquinate dehydratase/shikimate dehydrogenase, chloroplastic-like protein [Tanacetum coccineum]